MMCYVRLFDLLLCPMVVFSVYLLEYLYMIVMVDHKTDLLYFYFRILFFHVILSDSMFNWWSVFYNRMYSSESHVLKYLGLC